MRSCNSVVVIARPVMAWGIRITMGFLMPTQVLTHHGTWVMARFILMVGMGFGCGTAQATYGCIDPSWSTARIDRGTIREAIVRT